MVFGAVLPTGTKSSRVMGITQKAPRASTFGDTITTVAWKKKPSWYQVSTDDRMIAPQNQQWMAERLNAREILTLNASHASLASMPVEIAAFIDKAATALAAG